jgi:hypothetical protein
MSALLRYDLRILLNGAREAFGRKRDLTLLLLGLPLLLAALVRAVQEGSGGGPLVTRAMLALAGSVGFMVQSAVQRRLLHLRQDSVMAKAALQPGRALAYAAFWHVLAALLSIAAAAAMAPDQRIAAGAALFATLTYCAGIGLAVAAGMVRRLLPRLGAIVPSREAPAPVNWPEGERRARIARLLAEQAGVKQLNLAANVGLCAAIGASVGLAYSALSAAGAGQAALILGTLVLVILLSLLGRQHAPLWRFILFLGVRPAALTLVSALLAAALVAGAAIMLAGTGALPPGAVAGAGAILVLLFGFVAVMRALHYATRPRALADFAFQIDLLVIGASAFLMWLLAPVVALARLVQLRQRAEGQRWLLP